MPNPPRRKVNKVNNDDDAKVADFIKKKGVTPCPATGDPALLQYHKERDEDRKKEYERRTGRKVLTEEERAAKKQQYAAEAKQRKETQRFYRG